MRYRGEVSSVQENHSCEPATFPKYYVDEDCEADSDAGDLNAAEETSERTFSEFEFTELQDACRL